MKTPMLLSFIMDYDSAMIGDEIWFEFYSHNEQYNLFKEDLGYDFTGKSTPIDCAE